MFDNLEDQDNEIDNDALASSSDDSASGSEDQNSDAPADDNTPEGDKSVQSDAPPAEKKPEKESMLSKVESILGLGKKDKAKPDAKKAEGDDGAQPADQQAGASNKNGEKDDVVPKEIAEHPAYKKLQDQNKQYEASHERMGQLSSFMQQNKIDAQDFSAAMSSAAARKQSGVPYTEFKSAEDLTILAHTDPEKFYEKLTGMVEEYGVFLNKKLPSDLQKAVDDGEITETHAKELSKARMDKKISDRKAESASRRADVGEARIADGTREDIVNRWFDRTAKTDTELSFKVNAIEGELLRLIGQRQREGKLIAITDKDLFALLDEAHKNVTDTMRAGRPKQPVNPSPRSNPAPRNSQENNSASPKDKMLNNVLEIMNRNAG